MKKILFINPSLRPDSVKVIPNVGLAYVMSAIERTGRKFDLIDIDAHRYSNEKIRELISKADVDVVAIGTLASGYRIVKNMAQIIREVHPKAVIVIGNILGTSIPKLVLERTETDICVLAEGDLTFPHLMEVLDQGGSLHSVPGIAFLEKGQYVQTPKRELIENIDIIPFPNYSLFDMGVYIKASPWLVPNSENIPIPFDQLVSMPINTARGCPFSCNFCYHAFQHLAYRFRSPENIVAEMNQLKKKYKVNFFNLWDEISFVSHKQAEAFANCILKEDLNVYWHGSIRSEFLVRKEGGLPLAKLLKKSGCHALGGALESGSPEILQAMNKKNTVQEFIETAHIVREAGMEVYTSIVVGYPQETLTTIDETFKVLKAARVYPSAGFLQLLPGTPMYQYALDKGFIADEEAYMLGLADRQDLRINLTSLDDKVMVDHVVNHLRILNQDLNTGLDESTLLKTIRPVATKKMGTENPDTFRETLRQAHAA